MFFYYEYDIVFFFFLIVGFLVFFLWFDSLIFCKKIVKMVFIMININFVKNIVWSEFIKEFFKIGIMLLVNVFGICFNVFGLNSIEYKFCGFVWIIFLNFVIICFVFFGNVFNIGINLFVNVVFEVLFIIDFKIVILNVLLIWWKNWFDDVMILRFFFGKFFCNVNVNVGIIRFIFKLIIII